jgi:hypothetical protein
MAFFAVANFVKFFQQFAIDIAVRHFYSFALDGELHCLTTVPTGGVGPPLLAEALTRAICLGHQDINSVIYDTMIDNVRFVSDSAELLVQVWHNFIDICARVGITMGEVTTPSCTNGQTEYVFLGLSFRQLCGVTAGPKLGDKLARALVLLSSAGELAVLDWLAVFGVCSFVVVVACTDYTILLHHQVHPRNRPPPLQARGYPRPILAEHRRIVERMDLDLDRPQLLSHQHPVDSHEYRRVQ